MAVVNSSRINTREAIEWAVRNQLEHWKTDVLEVTQDVIQEVAKEATKKLKQQSPKGRRGRYSRGWAYKVDRARISVGATIYGKTGTYQLAHLLENGHAKRGGGRTAAIVHIKPVEEWAIGEVIDRVTERLSEF